MGAIKTFLLTVLAIVVAQIPSYFVQRYFFKKVLDRSLDSFEIKIEKLVKREKKA